MNFYLFLFFLLTKERKNNKLASCHVGPYLQGPDGLTTDLTFPRNETFHEKHTKRVRGGLTTYLAFLRNETFYWPDFSSQLNFLLTWFFHAIKLSMKNTPKNTPKVSPAVLLLTFLRNETFHEKHTKRVRVPLAVFLW